MPTGTGLKALEKAMPQHYYDVGIAEEHAVLFAAGLATMGFRPVCVIYSTFLQRSYDCLIHDVALQRLPVIFCLDRAGLSASDGPTHHGLFDIAFVRGIPNVIAMAPKDEDELVDMMHTAARQSLPAFIRYPRGPGEGVPLKSTPQILEIGKAELLEPWAQSGHRKVVLLALGNMVGLARQTRQLLLADRLDVAIINARFSKPLDEETILWFGQAAEVTVTLEDGILAGGFGGAVLELFNDRQIHTPVIRLGWPDQFIEHATTVKALREKYGLTAPHLAARIKTALASEPARPWALA